MIDLRDDVGSAQTNTRRLKNIARKLLRAAGQPDCELSIALVNDRFMRRLNREYRGKDKATDVLSFPQIASQFGDPNNLKGTPPQAAARPPRTKSVGSPSHKNKPDRFLGDIVISVDTAKRQAAKYGAPLQNELYRLLIHGLLHVLGHDHEKPAERAAMEAQERRLAAAIALAWPYD